MKYINALPKIFLALFFVIAVLVHVVGLLKPFSLESPYSHMAHIVCYGVCLFIIVKQVNRGIIIYLAASIYPYFIHIRCSWVQYADLNKMNAICIYTVAMLTAGWIFILYTNRKTNP